MPFFFYLYIFELLNSFVVFQARVWFDHSVPKSVKLTPPPYWDWLPAPIWIFKSWRRVEYSEEEEEFEYSIQPPRYSKVQYKLHPATSQPATSVPPKPRPRIWIFALVLKGTPRLYQSLLERENTFTWILLDTYMMSGWYESGHDNRRGKWVLVA